METFNNIYTTLFKEKTKKKKKKNNEPKYRILLHCPFHSNEDIDDDCQYYHSTIDCNHFIKFSQCRNIHCELQHNTIREEFHDKIKPKLTLLGIVDDMNITQTLYFIVFENVLCYQELELEKTELQQKIKNLKECLSP